MNTSGIHEHVYTLFCRILLAVNKSQKISRGILTLESKACNASNASSTSSRISVKSKLLFCREEQIFNLIDSSIHLQLHHLNKAPLNLQCQDTDLDLGSRDKPPVVDIILPAHFQKCLDFQKNSYFNNYSSIEKKILNFPK